MKNVIILLLILFMAGGAQAEPTITTTENMYDNINLRGVPYILGGFDIIPNTSARSATYTDVIEFLKLDTTENRHYVIDYYMCGNFSQKVYANAQDAGIKSGFVLMTFDDGMCHAVNSFTTTDRGIVLAQSHGAPGKVGTDYIINASVGKKMFVSSLNGDNEHVYYNSNVSSIVIYS